MDQPVTQQPSPAAKIALFRSLFRGRDDIHPRRFESRKTGKSGYSPACSNEWVRGLCDKKTTKCIDCPNRRFLPVTGETIFDAILRATAHQARLRCPADSPDLHQPGA
jgi:hypothetical protein